MRQREEGQRGSQEDSREESGVREEGHGGFGRHRASAAMGAETAKEGTIQWLYREVEEEGRRSTGDEEVTFATGGFLFGFAEHVSIV